MSGWKLQREVSPEALLAVRLPLHWTLQLVAAVGAAAVPRAPDDSHTTVTVMTRDGELWLAGGWSETPRRARAVLSLPELSLRVHGHDDVQVDRIPLEGETLSSALSWLEARFERELSLPEYDLPEHALADGAALEPLDAEALTELMHGFENAAMILADHVPETEMVRLWPHHLDIAFLEPRGGEKSVGVGWSAGDESYRAPYWYVAPWPRPLEASLPKLSHGHWHTAGFVAAVLTHADVVAPSSVRVQEREVRSFLQEGIAAARASVAGSEP